MTDRALSHWGWGFADRHPDQAGLISMGQMAQATLGYAPGEPREPVPIEAVPLAAPRVEAASTVADLLTDDHEVRIRHARGRSFPDQFKGLIGDFSGAPDLVARPRSAQDLERLYEWAGAQRIALVPYGGGTSVVGGVDSASIEGFNGVVTLDLTGFDQTLAIDETSRLAHLQAGLTGPRVEQALAAHGLTLRHFPQSFEHSTLGGWIATRAGGHFATLYTHIDDLVAGLTMVSPAGTSETRALPGSGAGPSPDRLALGSEGRLGVITDAWIRVRPRPHWRGRASVRFADYAQAVEATRAVVQSGLHPANCRLLDRREAALNGVTTDGSCVLLLGFESADHPIETALRRALTLAEASGGRCPEGPKLTEGAPQRGKDAAAAWRQAFIDAPYLQSHLMRLGLLVDTFETACTWAAFPELHGQVTEAVMGAMKRVCGRGRLTCRFTHVYPDGPAPYFTWIAPGRAGAELEQWAEIKAAASEALLAHGGTITHHHAVGRIHRPWAERQRPPLFGAALAAAARTFDPAGVLNPGCLIQG